MIPAGLSNALAAWADCQQSRIDALTAERDALVTGFLSGGQPTSVLTSTSINGSSFAWDPRLSAEEKLTVLTEVLTLLGVISERLAPVHMTYGSFHLIQR